MPVVSVYATKDHVVNWSGVPIGPPWFPNTDEVPQAPNDADFMNTNISGRRWQLGFAADLIPAGSTLTGWRQAFRVWGVGTDPAIKFKLFSLSPTEVWAESLFLDVSGADWTNFEVEFTELAVVAARANDGNMVMEFLAQGDIGGLTFPKDYVNLIPPPA